MRTAREVRTTVGGGRVQYPVTVPAGVRCVPLGNCWVVDDLSWLSPQDGAWHDAEHRGIVVSEVDLMEG